MKKYLGLFIVIFLSWWAVKPLFHPFMFPIHDDTQVVRVYEMAKALGDGQFPVRWVADLGYGFGYPIFNFYSPLPYYIGAVFVILGIDVLVATKLMFVIGILASGIFMYLLAREFWGEWGGIVCGLFYVYAPYHAVDIYVRGAVGEFWALAFLPLVAWGLYKVGTGPRWRWVAVGSAGLAAVILSHNITAMIFTPVFLITIFLYCLITKQKLSIICYLLSIIFLGLSLSAFFWLPAIKEMNYTQVFGQIGGGADFRDHFVYLDQLWASPWGFGGSAPGRLEGMSFMIGKLHILMTVIAFFTAILWWFKEKFRSRLILLSIPPKAGVASIACVLFYFLFSIFMTLEISKPLWQVIPAMAFIQYPWRFLVFVIFTASFLAGSALLLFKDGHLKLFAFCFLLFALLFSNTKYFKPKMYLNLSTADYLSDENIKWKTSKVSDEYLPKDFSQPKSRGEVVKEKLVPTKNITLGEAKILSSRYEFRTENQEEGNVLVKTTYFPGWKVFLDGKETTLKTPEGQILVSVPPGEHKVKVIFANTLVRTIGNLFSLITVFILMGGLIYERKKED